MRAVPSPPTASPAATRWRDRFRFDHAKVLIVCRGPVRLEAIQAFERMGARPSGILLSEKDSVVYPRALAPELRAVGRNERVHRIPDYAGGAGDQKDAHIERILAIAREGGYTHVFAGYGFMAEDHEFIGAVEAAGLGFVGPSSSVARQAGAKDAAKALARRLGVSVTPGVDNVAARALLSQAKGGEARVFLTRLARRHGLAVPAAELAGAPEAAAEALLRAAADAEVELVGLAALQAEAERQVAALLRAHPGARLRLKHVGGGGGKGQRVIHSARQAPDAVFEVLTEARATGPGDEKNFLIELNIEETRHNEIQLVGNGHWCVSLGGRDCSLQMHEQKLLEVSLTRELLEAARAEALAAGGRAATARALGEDLAVLQAMEREAEAFGEAVGLDSVSTFESIVRGRDHYFMEMNTRVQVEHRVTEMVYGLRFIDPDSGGAFEVDSLVEAMLWLALHGRALPRPERVARRVSGAEVRINATNDALRPHAGGVVNGWTPPGQHEVRDDQGIGIANPDTGTFMPYHLAGAYDSNACLVVSHGASREENLRRLAEMLRRMEIIGDDVMTNRAFHYGLIQWLLGHQPMAKPTTGFVRAYLAAVGSLKLAARDLDLEEVWEGLAAREGAGGPGAAEALAAKTTLLLRPLARLYAQPHLLAGWLPPRPERRWEVAKGRVRWLQNPLEVLHQLYRFLRWERHPDVAPEDRIWEQDERLLNEGLAFYAELRRRLGEAAPDWPALCRALERPKAPGRIPAPVWERARAAHRGFQAGLSFLTLPILTGEEAGFFGLRVNARLEPVVPPPFRDPALVEEAHAALAPPPPAGGNHIVAFSGGTFYLRSAPGQPPYVAPGDRFAAGDVVGLLEVMKMFNPVRALFSGTVRSVLVGGEAGVIVRKGQPLFDVEPDAPLEEHDPMAAESRRARKSAALLALL